MSALLRKRLICWSPRNGAPGHFRRCHSQLSTSRHVAFPPLGENAQTLQILARVARPPQLSGAAKFLPTGAAHRHRMKRAGRVVSRAISP